LDINSLSPIWNTVAIGSRHYLQLIFEYPDDISVPSLNRIEGFPNMKIMGDGGYIAVPRFGIFDENENWIIEGIGVYPDIEVIDRPEKLAAGEDPSIEKAVEVLLKELEENPVKKVKSPTPPDRSKWIEVEIN